MALFAEYGIPLRQHCRNVYISDSRLSLCKSITLKALLRGLQPHVMHRHNAYFMLLETFVMFAAFICLKISKAGGVDNA